MAKNSEWSMTDALQTAVSNMFSTVGQTAIDENGFKIQRVKETASCQRALSGKRKWFALLTSKVASAMFRYSELPGFRSTSIPSGFHWREMLSLYAGRVSASWQKLKLVVGSNRVPDWHSPSARNEIAGDVDLDSWRMLHSRGALDQVDKLFAGCLFSCSRMVVRNTACYGNRWFWPLSDSGVIGKFGWLAEAVTIGGQSYFRIAASPSAGDTPLLHLWDPSKWVVREVEWEAPAAVQARCGSAASAPAGPLARCVTAEPEPLLKFAARHGFFDMSYTALRALCQVIPDCRSVAKELLLDRLRRMMEAVLGKLTDAKFYECVHFRTSFMNQDVAGDLVDIENVEEVMADSDKKDLHKIQADSERSRATLAEWCSQLREYRRAREGAAGKAGGKCVPKPPWRANAYLKKLPEFAAGFSREDFDKLLPPGVRASKEAFHGRWRLFFSDGPVRSKSAGWDMHGWEGSVMLLFTFAWQMYEARTGHACPSSA